jgi:ribosomal-protein-alanine N-acetyltransferase
VSDPPGIEAQSGPAVRVRPAVEGDLPALADLEAAAFPDPGSPAWSRELLAGELAQPTAMMLVAVPEGASAPGGGRVLGYATFRRVGRESELLRVAVAPDRRDRGIGRRLIEAGLARLRDEGVATCFLEVRPTNAPALALYERLGFARISRRRRYFPDGSDALVLEVEIGGR